MTLNVRIGDNGGFWLKASSVMRGAKGVGASGAKYVGLQNIENHINIPLGASNETFVFNYSLIRQGEDGTLVMGDDMHIKERFHVTVNAQGMITSFHSDPPVAECK